MDPRMGMMLMRRGFQSMRDLKELTSFFLSENVSYNSLKENEKFIVDEYIATATNFIEVANKFKTK